MLTALRVTPSLLASVCCERPAILLALRIRCASAKGLLLRDSFRILIIAQGQSNGNCPDSEASSASYIGNNLPVRLATPLRASYMRIRMGRFERAPLQKLRIRRLRPEKCWPKLDRVVTPDVTNAGAL